ncbi:MAG: HNH endonuclease [Paludibacteraceae bacterium]|nr:HNH endonuclease [Paludibacteraceae bacterium]
MDRITNEEPTRYEQTSFSKKKNNENVKKWTDKDGAEVDNPKSCNNLVLHYNENFVPQNPKVNPPKPVRNEGKTDLMPWYGKNGIVEYYQNEGKIKNINPPVKDGKWDGSIPFNKDGVPDLEFLSRGTVTIGIKVYGKNILNGKGKSGKQKDGRDKNFLEANKALAEKRTPKCSADDVSKWMNDNGYTWHEMDENGTMQKVPSAVHGAVYHYGGVDLFKKLHKDGKLDAFGFTTSGSKRKTGRKLNRNKKSKQ